MIRIAVTSSPWDLKGIDHLKDTGGFFDCLGLDEALRKEWAVDAHFVGYAPLTPDGRDLASLTETENWPRLRKPALDHIRDIDGEVHTNLFIFDYDLNENVSEDVLLELGWDGKSDSIPKVRWTPDLMGDFSDRLGEAKAHFQSKSVAWANYIYTTKHGARFIHVLSEGIKADDGEAYWRGLMEIYNKVGLVMDFRCNDWTRVFRLPKVIRDGKPSWTGPFFRLITQFEEFLVLDGIEPIVKAHNSKYATIKPLDIPLPTPEESMSLLEVIDDNNRIKQTEAYKISKRVLKNLDCFPIIFENQSIGSTGERDHNLLRMIGQAVAYLHSYNTREGVQTFTPQHVYGLFLQAVQELEPDSGTPSWEHSAWSKILRCWARETAKADAVKATKEEQEIQVEDKIDSMLKGVSRWAPSVAAQSHEHALATLSQILIAATPSGTYHIMTPKGTYTEHGVRASYLKAVIREAGMDDLIQFECMLNGRMVRKSVEDLMAEYGTVVNHVVGKIATRSAYIDNLRSRDATLILPMYHRVDMPGCFSKHVDKWLQLLVETPDDYLRLCKWIGYALDFEGGPICALSLSGPPSVGKKLLARGLSECVNTARSATGFDMVQKFNEVLKLTPFLIVDEGLPSRLPGGLDIADKFRQFVGGETITIDEKYKTRQVVNNPMRIVFTANNHEILQQLTRHRDLSPYDQHALGIRIQHFEAQMSAAQYLACPDITNPDFGGLAFTRGWVAGDAGQASDYVVAQHFLWLYENRHRYGQPEPRLLVEGNANSEVMQEMATNSGCAPDIIETLISMIEDSRTSKDGVAIDEETGDLFVTTTGILSFFRSDLTISRRVLDNKKIAGVLRSLAVEIPKHPTEKETLAGNTRRYRWWRLDTVKLLKWAVDSGMRHTRLELLVRQQYGNAATDCYIGATHE